MKRKERKRLNKIEKVGQGREEKTIQTRPLEITRERTPLSAIYFERQGTGKVSGASQPMSMWGNEV